MDDVKTIQSQLEMYERERAKLQRRIDRQGDIRDRLESGAIDAKQALVEWLNIDNSSLDNSMTVVDQQVRILRDLLEKAKRGL